MKRMRKPLRMAASGVVIAAFSGAVTTAVVPSASAASGGGCKTGSAGPAYQVSSCISAPAAADAIGDGYVYMHSVPAGCTVTVRVWDIDLNYIATSATVKCATSMHVTAPEVTQGFDTFETQVLVNGSSAPWSPPEYLP